MSSETVSVLLETQQHSYNTMQTRFKRCKSEEQPLETEICLLYLEGVNCGFNSFTYRQVDEFRHISEY